MSVRNDKQHLLGKEKKMRLTMLLIYAGLFFGWTAESKLGGWFSSLWGGNAEETESESNMKSKRDGDNAFDPKNYPEHPEQHPDDMVEYFKKKKKMGEYYSKTPLPFAGVLHGFT